MKPILLIFMMLASSTVFSQSPFKIEQYIANDIGLLPENLTVNGIAYKDLYAGLGDVTDNYLGTPLGDITIPTVSGRRTYFCLGLTAEYKVASKIFLRTGLGYWYRKFNGYRIDPPSYYYQGGGSTFAIRHFDLSQGVRYYFTTSRLAVYADAGLSGSWLYKNKAYYFVGYKDDRMSTDPLPVAKLSLSAYAGVGAGFSFTPVWQINVAVVYKNGITPYIHGVDYRMKSIGVTLGLAMKIGERRSEE